MQNTLKPKKIEAYEKFQVPLSSKHTHAHKIIFAQKRLNMQSLSQYEIDGKSYVERKF